MIYPYIKRLMDIVLSFIALVIFSPVLIVIAVIVRATSEGPALFRQMRSGKDLVEFEIYKFRTMYVSAPKNVATHQLAGAQSFITPVGMGIKSTKSNTATITGIHILFFILSANRESHHTI